MHHRQSTESLSHELLAVSIGFFLYGIRLGGGWMLQELVWATYFGRVSLGMVRGLGILVTHAFGAAGAPFFGFAHDLTGSYPSSFIAFVIAPVLSALLSVIVRAPAKARQFADQPHPFLVVLGRKTTRTKNVGKFSFMSGFSKDSNSDCFRYSARLNMMTEPA